MKPVIISSHKEFEKFIGKEIGVSDYLKITQERIKSIDADLMKEQRPGMPINIDRQSRVTFGGGRKS